MEYKKILTIQDISCVGQCSLTVALPILSACGLETCILPSAVLSTHTAGFSGFTFRDLTDDMPKIQEHWQKENIKFKAIYTGYLGSVKQVGYVRNILDTMGTDDCIRIVDPAMADNGKLYSIFNDEYVKAMRELCASADILIPNITEAAFLAEVEYRELTEKLTVLEGELKFLLIPKDPNDDRNVIVEIRAGAGGEEAALFAGDLFRMYSMFSTREGFRLEIVSVNEIVFE